MAHKLIIANWKMNGSLAGLAGYLNAVADIPVVVCPPAPLLAPAVQLLNGTSCQIGAQDCHAEVAGAFTGDISATLLNELGVKYVIVGHSERRRGHSESDAFVWRKANLAASLGVTPILCVGEKEGETTDDVIKSQLQGLNSYPGKAIVIAYEPVWAISAAGTGRMPQPQEINSIHFSIKAILDKICPNVSNRVVYGGSVKPENAAAIMQGKAVDGVLVGAASLEAAQLRAIYEASLVL